MNKTSEAQPEKSPEELSEESSEEQTSVVLFGTTGQGKSSIANMLIQGDIYQEKNAFIINDSAVGASVQIACSVNSEFKVYDTIGVGETCFGSVPHKKAIKKIRKYFSKCRVPLNYISYVKKKGRYTEEDRKMFKAFKKIFKGGERNFIIIITGSDQKWVDDNSKTIKENFGDYPIIPVDFSQGHEDKVVIKRAESLQRLTEKLSNLEYKGIKLEVLSQVHIVENRASKVINLIPYVGTTYQLISSGVYYKIGKLKLAKERMMNAMIGVALDSVGLYAIQAGHSVITEVAKNVGVRITGKVAKKIEKEMTKEK